VEYAENFPKNFQKNVFHNFEGENLQISGMFPASFGCFLAADIAEKKC